MLRLHDKDLNTPAYFDEIWRREGIHCYDATRLREFLKFTKDGDYVLDVGAGWNGFAQYALDKQLQGAKRARLIAADFSMEAARRTRSLVDLPYLQCHALNLPFMDAVFDVAGSGELIEHMEDPVDLIREMARVTKPGGWLVVSTLDTECAAAKAHGDYPEHLWEFTPRELTAMFQPFGVTKYWLFGHYHMVSCRTWW